eukprot:TRINITY_DN90689_c0_g1_i1.p1 TRINITY_DN90689_c0_g1~~TRINITY_DN90689_c0_g1_i1.p1  ORF type:complete len:346 (+),score=67.06 TRINITY_DN90689_c0_g1_i1:94-1131(+)
MRCKDDLDAGLELDSPAEEITRQKLRTVFRSCQGKSCGPKGGPHLLRDIEELAWESPDVEVEPSDCLGLCGLGPNVEVRTAGGEPFKMSGNKSWAKVEELVIPHLRVPPSELRRRLGMLKFAHRREHVSSTRLALLQAAFDQLESVPNLDEKEPQLWAELLALRAQNWVVQRQMSLPGFGSNPMQNGLKSQKDAASPTSASPTSPKSPSALLSLVFGCESTADDDAVADAKRAVQLSPEWPQARKVLAITLEEAGQREEATSALRDALELNEGKGLNRVGLLAHLRRLTNTSSGPEQAEFLEAHSREEPLHPSCRGDYEYRIPETPKVNGNSLFDRFFACMTPSS